MDNLLFIYKLNLGHTYLFIFQKCMSLNFRLILDEKFWIILDSCYIIEIDFFFLLIF